MLTNEKANENPKLGLALSGGGFRATLFHLGVIRYIRAKGLLENITCIASVSGGSILAAHLWANWDKYVGDTKDFDNAASQLITIAKKDIRGRIQRRLPFLYILSLIPFLPPRLRITPSKLLERYYDKYLFHGHHFSDFVTKKQPAIRILSTNLSKASLTCFSPREAIHIPIDKNKQTTLTPISITPLSRVVAASSAYPGLFPPLRLTEPDLGAQEGSFEPQYFTDGGLFDNLGLHGLTEGDLLEVDYIIVSDAGRSFVPAVGYIFGLLRTALRAVDIFMFRIRNLELSRQINNSKIIALSISSNTNLEGASDHTIQKQLENIRTDLDFFSDTEINELYRHGFYIAAHSLGQKKISENPVPDAWHPPARIPKKKSARLRLAYERALLEN